LSFDVQTGLFSGTPGNDDVGSLPLLVTATGANNTVSSEVVDFTVLNANDAPTFTASSLSAQSATLTQPFLYQIPTTAFNDVDIKYADHLTFSASATLTDGTPTTLPTGIVFDTDTGTFSGMPTGAAETVIVRVTATDTSGASASGQFNLSVAVLDHAPTLTDPIAHQTVPTATEGTTFSFQLAADTFHDQDVGDSLTYSVQLAGSGSSTALPGWLHFDPTTGIFSGQPARSDAGSLTIKVTATDQAGAQVADSFSLNVQALPHAPVLTSAVANQTATQGTAIAPIKLAFTADHPTDGLVLTATQVQSDGSTVALPSWLTFDAQAATFTGTPATSGTLDIRVTALDTTNHLSTSSDFALTVNAINHAPTVVSTVSLAPTAAAKEGSLSTWQLPTGHFADQDTGDHLTFTVSSLAGGNLPSWLTFNQTTNTFSAAPGVGTAGTVGIKVTATDVAGASVSDTFNLTVDHVNHAPVLNTAQAPLNQQATVGGLFSFQVASGTFTDPDPGDHLSYTATLQGGGTLPGWLTFDPNTQLFSGTPVLANVGTVHVTVSASDGSLAATDTFAITVADLNHAPTRSSSVAALQTLVQNLGEATIQQGHGFSLTLPTGLFTDQDAADATLALSAVNMVTGAALPTWLTFNSTTGVFSGTPGATDVGSLSVKVIATDHGGLTAADAFTINVQAVDKAPVLSVPTLTQTINDTGSFLLSLNAGTFTDPNPGHTLTVTAQLSDGGILSALPAWLHFDAGSLSFSGTPPVGAGNYSIVVTATDSASTTTNILAATDTFNLTVA
ncbi:MAG: putative Ig domain-containing protein, partial [Magnetococcales bacterium]|nr:putative Ig domain-containing protein [Magnetococcales bacterium]